ncbi:MAG: NAD(P)-dependent alcohol dehydrogenase [Bacteroidota bacterium]
MKAIIHSQYGGPEVLKLEEVEKPQAGPKEVLIKVMASSITTADSMMMTGKPYIGRLILGLSKPKHAIPGTGFAGIIEAVGQEVTSYKVGDEVFGESLNTFGAQAQYLCLAEDDLFMHKPASVSFEEAATVGDGVMTSLNFLQLVTEVEPGKKVLINGAAGSLGSAAVQIAAHYGAHVTAVCSSKNAEFVKSLGAQEVIDYSQEDFTKRSNQFDIIYDTVGKSSFDAAKNSLTKDGVYASPVLDGKLLLKVLWTSIWGNKKAKFSATGFISLEAKRQIQSTARNLMNLGSVRPYISKRYRLDQFQEAHSYIASGHKRGNIVFTPFQ